MSSGIACECVECVFLEWVFANVVASVFVRLVVRLVVTETASFWQRLSCGWLICVEAPGLGGGPPLGRHFGKSRFKSAFSKIRLVIATPHSFLLIPCPFWNIIYPHHVECYYIYGYIFTLLGVFISDKSSEYCLTYN